MKIKMPALIMPAFLLILSACASYQPARETAGKMSPAEARKTILKNKHPHYQIRFTPTLLITNDTRALPLLSVGKIIQRGMAPDQILVYDNEGKQIGVWFGAPDPRAFADALHNLVEHARTRARSADAFEAGFAAALDGYKSKAASGEPIPEEALRHKIQAEGSIKDKDFTAADEFYAEALKAAPWWAAGHYNRALVLGELEDYALARTEMRYYLQLLPDAENARAAQNKIYDWERLESK